jgi:hypothetical protein
MTTAELESEDILSDSLEFLGGKPVIEDSKILYGPLVLSLAPKVRPWFIIQRLSSFLFLMISSGRQSALPVAMLI